MRHYITIFMICLVARTAMAQDSHYNWHSKISIGINYMMLPGSNRHWLENNAAPEIRANVGYKAFNFNLDITAHDLILKNNLLHQDLDVLLPPSTKMMVPMINLSLSYEFVVDYNLIIEPFAGVVFSAGNTNFRDPETKSYVNFTIPGSASAGVRSVKYFRIGRKWYMGPYLGVYYNNVRFNTINENMENNVILPNAGIVFKEYMGKKKEDVWDGT